jgi:hypothetical protein
MSAHELKTTEVQGLRVFSNPFDLRRDLHTFIDYVRSREVKRSHRSNSLQKADVQRLLKVLSDAQAASRLDQEARESWLMALDEAALRLGFVSYDTEGIYAGYNSSEPSFPDNYVQFNADTYSRFLNQPLLAQEEALLTSFIGYRKNGDNEFFSDTELGELDHFSSYGCATGVVPGLDFAKARRHLLDILATCTPGLWYETASLVQLLKHTSPYFLIPKEPKFQYAHEKGSRYGNFSEHDGNWGRTTAVSQADPDAFERVEGRFVERFLEGMPLSFGYVAVAYGESTLKGRFPTLNQLRAFRVSETFVRFWRKSLAEPKVTVQPDFSVHVDSGLYPASVLNLLADLADFVATDRVSVLRLSKKKVAAKLVQDQSLDVIGLLAGLSSSPLPQNVRAELEEWIGHSEIFTLYEGYGLWEGDADLPAAQPFVVRELGIGTGESMTRKHSVNPVRLVRSPHALFACLEQAEFAPLLAKHPRGSLAALPHGAVTLFNIRAPRVAAKKQKEAITFARKTTVTLVAPTAALLEECRKAMIQAGCPIEVEPACKTISYQAHHTKLAEAGLKLLGTIYDLKVEDATI